MASEASHTKTLENNYTKNSIQKKYLYKKSSWCLFFIENKKVFVNKMLVFILYRKIKK